jgi:hypothetical protein
LYNHVPNFARESICTALQFAAHHNATTDTSAKRDNDSIHRSASSSGFPFPICGHRCIVFNMHTDSET